MKLKELKDDEKKDQEEKSWDELSGEEKLKRLEHYRRLVDMAMNEWRKQLK